MKRQKRKRRIRAKAIVDAFTASTSWTSGGAPCGEEEEANVAEDLSVPQALIVLAGRQVTIAQIDELVAWWPRKDGA